MKLRHIVVEGAAAPAAPPVPVKPTTKPFTPSKPSTPQHDPFNPPKPSIAPAPKARKKSPKSIKEDFDNDVNDSTVKFWNNIRTGQHAFSKHPLLAMYGKELASGSYEDNLARVKKVFPELAQVPAKRALMLGMQKLQQLYMNIVSIERRHQDELQQLAINAVSQTWNVPKDQLTAYLGRIVDNDDDGGDSDDDGDDEYGYDKESSDGVDENDIGRHVNKRITMNMLSHGAGVHNMMTLHNIVMSEVKKIDERLFDMYDQISAGSYYNYWSVDFEAFMNMLGQSKAGQSFVNFDGEKPTVVASAVVFPVLVQELVKGTMELLSAHGLSDYSPAQLKHIYSKADVLEDEPWLLQVGPKLWSNFLKIVPKGSNLARVVAKFAMQDPEFIHDILSKMIEDINSGKSPDAAKQSLATILIDAQEGE